MLYFDGDEVLIVKPTYKPGWEIPGGYVNRGESPLSAARREVREELGLELEPGRLLAFDYAPYDGDDKYLFLFDGGELTDTQRNSIRLGFPEISAYRYCRMQDLRAFMPPRLARRVAAAARHRGIGVDIYLDYGRGRSVAMQENTHGDLVQALCADMHAAKGMTTA